MIATLAEIKTLLGITGTTYDTLIQTYIPIVTEDIVEYCNNDFVAKDSYGWNKLDYTNDFAFVDGGASADTITDSDSAFITEGFVAGDDILVTESMRNDGYYTIASIAAGELTLTETIDSLKNEDLGDDITIELVQFPKGLKIPFARMVGWLTLDSNNQTGGYKSERLGDYSYTLADGLSQAGASQYPNNVVNGLNFFRKIRMS